ncbi:MAG: type II toxin-antitoxin system RelE/ParE family toxin [Elusimicrobia bacterium]|nr:type II toxin-antitoxin system RelE/ParE family toxin [Elusimicrobiota bacterium]
MDLRRYQTAEGCVPYSDWIRALDSGTAGRISAYVDRMKYGNFGRSEPVGRGVSELKIDFGPGYRVYYLQDGGTVVVLLCGGDKSSQQGDIRLAQEFSEDYWRRR